MPTPYLWNKQSFRLRRYPVGSGKPSTLIETWDGPSELFAEFEASLVGYSYLDVIGEVFAEDGSGILKVDVSWATDSDGDKVPSTATDFGLKKREWRLSGGDVQVPLEECAKVQSLTVGGGAWWWPAAVRQYMTAYKAAVRAYWSAYKPSVSATPAPPKYHLTPPSPRTDKDWGPAGLMTAPATASAEQIAIANTFGVAFLTTDNPVVPRSLPVLSKIETVISASSIVCSHAFVDRYLTLAKVIELEPTLNNPTLPEIAMLTLSGLSSYLWLKKSPTVTAATGSDIEITQEYHGSAIPDAGSIALDLLQLGHGDIVDVDP